MIVVCEDHSTGSPADVASMSIPRSSRLLNDSLDGSRFRSDYGNNSIGSNDIAKANVDQHHFQFVLPLCFFLVFKTLGGQKLCPPLRAQSTRRLLVAIPYFSHYFIRCLFPHSRQRLQDDPLASWHLLRLLPGSTVGIETVLLLSVCA